MKNNFTLALIFLPAMLLAQINPIDFEPTGIGADWTWTVFENDTNPPLEIIVNPVPGGINTSQSVAKFTALSTGMPFAGCETMHGTTEKADFMLKSWLDAGGEMGAVAEALLLWLDQHGTTEEADFVLRSWLEAKGDFAVVKDAAIAWLSRHRTSPDAVFITKFLAGKRDLPTTTVQDILTWCQAHPSNSDAVWRFSRLGENLLRPELTDQVVLTAEVVLELIVEAKATLDSRQVSPVMSAFWLLIDLLGSSPTTEKKRLKIDRLLADWLRRRDSFAIADPAETFQQRPPFVLKIADLLRQGLLDAEADRQGLESFCLWVNQWRADAKLQTRQIVAYLRRTYPQVDYWDRIEFR